MRVVVTPRKKGKKKREKKVLECKSISVTNISVGRGTSEAMPAAQGYVPVAASRQKCRIHTRMFGGLLSQLSSAAINLPPLLGHAIVET